MARGDSAKRLKELESANAVLQAKMELLMELRSDTSRVQVANSSVGVRNTSTTVVGLRDDTVSPAREYQLAVPKFPKDYAAVAVIPFAFWQSLKRGPLVALGIITRDDTILGPADSAGPADRPEELPEGTVVNLIDDPQAWVDARTEDQLREDLRQITSKYTLWALRTVVDKQIVLLRDGKFKDQDDRGQKAWDYLPGKYKLVDEIVMQRLINEFSISAGKWDTEGQMTPRTRSRTTK